jgi:hypothetical protein
MLKEHQGFLSLDGRGGVHKSLTPTLSHQMREGGFAVLLHDYLNPYDGRFFKLTGSHIGSLFYEIYVGLLWR